MDGIHKNDCCPIVKRNTCYKPQQRRESAVLMPGLREQGETGSRNERVEENLSDDAPG